MSSAQLESAVAEARDRYEKADRECRAIGDEVAKATPEQRQKLDAAFTAAAEYRNEAGHRMSELQSEYVAETLLERYGDDQEAAICQGKTLEEANEIADANLFENMTGKEHVGDREDLHADVAWEMKERFGEEKAAAYQHARGDQAQEQAAEQAHETQTPEMER